MNSYLFKEKIAAQVGFEPQHTAYEAEALPTELYTDTVQLAGPNQTR